MIILQGKLTDIPLWIGRLFIGGRKVAGQAYPETIIIRSDIDKHSAKWKRVYKHEKTHVEQYRRYWYIGFPFLYIYQYLWYGYRNMPLEVEARQNEG